MEKVLKINVPEGYEIDKERSTFESIVFRPLPKPRLPKSWEELEGVGGYYLDAYGNVRPEKPMSYSGFTYSGNRATWPTREEAEASIALAQLLQLRDRYNEHTGVFGDYWPLPIEYPRGLRESMVISFKNSELRDKFLSCPEIRKLIEIAKPLL